MPDGLEGGVGAGAGAGAGVRLPKHVHEFGPARWVRGDSGSAPGAHSDGGADARGAQSEREELLRRNERLHDSLNASKNCITRHARTWDVYKRCTNEYELVYPGISAHSPISRSFFKLWEMLHDFGLTREGKMRATFLAEGPGGFMEAFAMFRAGKSGDEIHGMTLHSRNRGIPGWKVKVPFTLHRGADGTGNLYSAENVDHLAAAVGPGTCHHVTADGGFDFSTDYNSQEETSTRLIVAEIYAALRLQAPGGAFVLKIYDMRSPQTVGALYLLRTCYAGLRVVKPLTSRPANSERYVVCTGFVGPPQGDLVATLRSAVESGNLATLAVPVPVPYLRDVVAFNARYVAHQVAVISDTIAVIKGACSGAKGCCETKEERARRVRRQLAAAARWCHEYSLRISVPAMRTCLARTQ